MRERLHWDEGALAHTAHVHLHADPLPAWLPPTHDDRGLPLGQFARTMWCRSSLREVAGRYAFLTYDSPQRCPTTFIHSVTLQPLSPNSLSLSISGVIRSPRSARPAPYGCKTGTQTSDSDSTADCMHSSRMLAGCR